MTVLNELEFVNKKYEAAKVGKGTSLIEAYCAIASEFYDPAERYDPTEGKHVLVNTQRFAQLQMLQKIGNHLYAKLHNPQTNVDKNKRVWYKGLIHQLEAQQVEEREKSAPYTGQDGIMRELPESVMQELEILWQRIDDTTAEILQVETNLNSLMDVLEVATGEAFKPYEYWKLPQYNGQQNVKPEATTDRESSFLARAAARGIKVSPRTEIQTDAVGTEVGSGNTSHHEIDAMFKKEETKAANKKDGRKKKSA